MSDQQQHPNRVVCVLIANFAPRQMIYGFARYNTTKRIKTIVGVFASFEEYQEVIRKVPAAKIEKYARCKLNVENKRLPYVYDYEGSVPQMEYSNDTKTEPYQIFWSQYFTPEWDLEKDPNIETTDKNLRMVVSMDVSQ